MLKLFGSSKSDHPMADIKEAKRVLEEVPANDAFKALDELDHWLESVQAAEGFKPEYRAQLTLLIDEAAQAHVRKLQRDYLSNPSQSRFQEQRLWNAIHGYWVHATKGFVALVDLNASGAKGADALKNMLPLLAVRALRALAAQMKWQYLRYGPFDDALWAVVARVYGWAESRKITQAKVSPYPGAAGAETTPELEFLRAVMLAASSPDSLLPAEIEIAERLIAHLSASFKVTPEQQPDIAHWIDLAAGHPPLRLARPPQHAPTLRFFTAGTAMQDLDRLIQAIGASGSVPGALNLVNYDAAMVQEVLRHLAMYWSPKPPEREHQRHHIKSRLNVTGGFLSVYTALDPSASLEFEQSSIENWIVEDVSAGGFGASIPQLKGAWLRLGALVALQPEGGSNWIIGLIRRLSRDTPQQGSVGIQSLAMTAVPVRLTVAGIGGTGEPAVLLSHSIDAAEVQFLLKAGVHGPGQNYEFQMGDMAVVLMQAAVVEQGEDYELLRAKQMVRDTGE